MKFIALFVLLAVSCSKSPSNSPQGGSGSSSNIIELSSLTLNSELIEGINSIPNAELDFGSLEKGQVVSQDLIIMNKQLASLSIAASDIDASSIAPFEMSSNTCVTTLARNRSCKIVIQLKNPSALAESSQLAKSLSIKGSSISLTGEQLLFVESTAPVAGVTLSPSSLNFGTLKSGQVKELAVIVNNKSMDSQSIVVPSLSNPKITLTNACPASLARNRSCSLKFKYTASEDEEFLSEPLISLLNNPLTYSVVVASPTQENPEVLQVSPSSSSASATLTEPAVQQGTIEFTNSGTVALPSPVTAVSSHAGLVVNSFSCASGLARNRSCSVSYSVNASLLPEGASSQTIRLQSGAIASSSFSLSLNITKLTVACSLQNALDNNVVVANSNSQIVGMKFGADISQCLLAPNACSQFYQLASSSKSCDAKACSSLSAGEVTALEFNLTGGSLSGTYPSCSLSCASSFQEVVAKACVDKTPSGTVTFNQDLSTSLTTNPITITQVNAQKIQFYSDAACSNSASGLLDVAPQMNLALSAGDGTKNLYAKLLNGSKSSACLTDSIVLDATGPVATSVKYVEATMPEISSENDAALKFSYSSTSSPKLIVQANEAISSCSVGIGSSIGVSNITSQIKYGANCENLQVTFTGGNLLENTTYYVNVSLNDSYGNAGPNVSKEFKYRQFRKLSSKVTPLSGVIGNFAKTLYRVSDYWVFVGTNNKIYSVTKTGAVTVATGTYSEAGPAVGVTDDTAEIFFVANIDKIYKLNKINGAVTLVKDTNFNMTGGGHVNPKLIVAGTVIYYMSNSVDGLPYRISAINNLGTAVGTTYVQAPASGVGTGTGHKALAINSVVFVPLAYADMIYVSTATTLLFPCNTQANTVKMCVLKSASAGGNKTATPLQTETYLNNHENPQKFIKINSTVFYTSKNGASTNQIYKVNASSTFSTMAPVRVTTDYLATENVDVKSMVSSTYEGYVTIATSLYKFNSNASSITSDNLIDTSVNADPLVFMNEIYSPTDFSSIAPTHLVYHVDMFGQASAHLIRPDGEKRKLVETDEPSNNYTYIDGFSLTDEFNSWGYALALVTDIYGQVKILNMDLHKSLTTTWKMSTPANVNPKATSSLTYFNDKAYFSASSLGGSTDVGSMPLNFMNDIYLSEVYAHTSGLAIEFVNASEEGKLLADYGFQARTSYHETYTPFGSIYLPPNSITVVHSFPDSGFQSQYSYLQEQKLDLMASAASRGYYLHEHYMNLNPDSVDLAGDYQFSVGHIPSLDLLFDAGITTSPSGYQTFSPAPYPGRKGPSEWNDPHPLVFPAAASGMPTMSNTLFSLGYDITQ